MRNTSEELTSAYIAPVPHARLDPDSDMTRVWGRNGGIDDAHRYTAGIRLGSCAGIRIYIGVSRFIIVALLSFSLAIGWFPYCAPGLSA